MNNDPFELKGKRGIVTGAGRNVGRAIVELLAKAGVDVGIVDIDQERGNATLDRVREIAVGRGLFVPTDVSDETSVQNMVGAVCDAFGGVDILVNCVASTDRPTTITELSLDQWHRVMDVSLTSVFLCTKWVSRQMIEQGAGGAIVNIGSTSAHKGRGNAVAYGPAKAAVSNMTWNTATQLGPHRIRVNTVSPNMVGSPVGEDVVDTSARKPTNLLGRACTPEDIANAVAFMASDMAGFVTASELLVDGGSLHGGKV